MDSVVENGQWTEFKTLDGAVCITHSAKSLGKGINPTILDLAMSKLVKHTLVGQPV